MISVHSKEKRYKETHGLSFDHTTIVAKDDPMLPHFKELAKQNLIQLRIFDDVGCEKFAEYVFDYINKKVQIETDGRVKVLKVESFEGGTNNSAIYQPSSVNEMKFNYKEKINKN